MGWLDAPVVQQARPKWQEAPTVGQVKPAEAEPERNSLNRLLFGGDRPPENLLELIIGTRDDNRKLGGYAGSVVDRMQENPGNGYAPSSVPALDIVNAFGTSLAENIPVIGKPLSDFGNQVDAAWASMLEGKPVTAEERARMTEAEQQQFPEASISGAVAGNVLPFLPLASTQTGARLLGMIGPMWQRALYGGGTGGAISAADRASEGGDLGDVLLNGGLGAAAGASFPWIERGITNLFLALTGRLPPKDLSVVNKALERDDIDLTQLAQKMDELGPEAVLADLGPNTLQTAAAVTAQPGRGRQIVTERLEQRQANANARIRSDVDASFGPAPMPPETARDLRDTLLEVKGRYPRLLGEAASGDMSRVAASVDEILANAEGPAEVMLQRVRGLLDYPIPAVPGLPRQAILDPNPTGWLKAREAIDRMLDDVANRGIRGELTEVRKQIDEMLMTHVPGIKELDDLHRELSRQEEALSAGPRLLDPAVQPSEVDAALVAGALPEGQFIGPSGTAFRLSQRARADIDDIIGSAVNDFNALKNALNGDGSWNRSKLVSAFGPQKADQLIAVLERETRFNGSFNYVLGNGEIRSGHADVSPALGNDPLAGLFNTIPQTVANTAARMRPEAVNARIAAALMNPPPPAYIDQLIAARALANRKSLLAPGVTAALTQTQWPEIGGQ
jgi:hypothetical protein